MNIIAGERPSDSPYVQGVWWNHSLSASTFTSAAVSNWEMVVTKLDGKTSFTIRGPETRATSAYCPPDGDFFGIVFRHGAFMPHLSMRSIMDRQNFDLPEAGSSRSVWLGGAAWEIPTYENADVFVNRLVREGLLVWDTVVEEALKDQPLVTDVSIRTVHRRILRATGLHRGFIRQIERARHAAVLLRQGKSILDTVYEADYFDQAHLTRSLKQFVGRTPAQFVSSDPSELMSF